MIIMIMYVGFRYPTSKEMSKYQLFCSNYSVKAYFGRDIYRCYMEQTRNQPFVRPNHNYRILPTTFVMYDCDAVDQVIFACSNFREFLILVLFTKLRICEFSFFFSRFIIIKIFAGFLNREIRKN